MESLDQAWRQRRQCLYLAITAFCLSLLRPSKFFLEQQLRSSKPYFSDLRVRRFSRMSRRKALNLLCLLLCYFLPQYCTYNNAVEGWFIDGLPIKLEHGISRKKGSAYIIFLAFHFRGQMVIAYCVCSKQLNKLRDGSSKQHMLFFCDATWVKVCS